jgi:hypothetical protein
LAETQRPEGRQRTPDCLEPNNAADNSWSSAHRVDGLSIRGVWSALSECVEARLNRVRWDATSCHRAPLSLR